MWEGWGGSRVVSQLLMPSPKLPKTQIPYVQWGRGSVTTFDAESKNRLNPKFPMARAGGGEGGDHVRHLVRNWGEQNFYKSCFHLLRPTASYRLSPAEMNK